MVGSGKLVSVANVTFVATENDVVDCWLPLWQKAGKGSERVPRSNRSSLIQVTQSLSPIQLYRSVGNICVVAEHVAHGHYQSLATCSCSSSSHLRCRDGKQASSQNQEHVQQQTAMLSLPISKMRSEKLQGLCEAAVKIMV